ncbi:methyltransferase family protein [Metabacillus idriensis]|uniref:methyltransferase family protein n=1 Tax=Metabacillus idriensis TaxID=324768 RepID=UPI003D26E6DE
MISLLFFIITAIWIAEFILYRDREFTEEETNEKRSYPFIFLVFASTIISAVLMKEWRIFYLENTLIQLIGLMLFAAGVFLRYWGIVHLRQQFTRHVSVRINDELVSSGPYRLLRHPLYTGLLLIIIGICLSLGNIVLAIVGGSAGAFTLIQRIRIEERMLIKAYGEEYRSFAKKRYRLFPPFY